MIKSLRPALAERGKIKIGDKGQVITSRQGKKFQPPLKLDHFRITTTERDEADRLIEDKELTAKLAPEDGGKIREIPIRLLYDDPELNFPTWLAAYDGNKLWCVGDGESAERLQDNKAGRQVVKCPCEHSDPNYTGPRKCKPNGKLLVVIEGAERIGGVWTFRTTSYNSVTAIMSSLALIKTMTGGYLSGIPLRLVVGPKRAVTPEGAVQTVHIVTVEYPGPESELLLLAQEIGMARAKHKVLMADLEAEAKRQLEFKPTPDSEKPEEIVPEFYPEEAKRALEAERGEAGAKGIVDAMREAERKTDPPADPTVGEDERPIMERPLRCSVHKCEELAYWGLRARDVDLPHFKIMAFCPDHAKRVQGLLFTEPPRDAGSQVFGRGLDAQKVTLVEISEPDCETVQAELGPGLRIVILQNDPVDLGEAKTVGQGQIPPTHEGDRRVVDVETGKVVTPGEDEINPVKCGKCGVEYPDDVSQCPECGTPSGKLF
jgi:hypothetical protein